jgi:hypothetical protein
MTKEELQQIEQRCAQATKGPWKSWIEGRDHTSGSSFISTSEQDIELLGATNADQDFMAAARQDVPALLAQIAQPPTPGEIDAAARVLDEMGRHHSWRSIDLPRYDELDPISKSEFAGLAREMLLAARRAREVGVG